MTEYYENSNSRYYKILNNSIKIYKFKIELLNHYEHAIGEIVNDISSDTQGQITINKQQGMRRSCSFSLINVEKKLKMMKGFALTVVL